MAVLGHELPTDPDMAGLLWAQERPSVRLGPHHEPSLRYLHAPDSNLHIAGWRASWSGKPKAQHGWLFRKLRLGIRAAFANCHGERESLTVWQTTLFRAVDQTGRVNSPREMCRSERNFGRLAAWRGQRRLAENGRIPGLQRADRRAERLSPEGFLAEGERFERSVPVRSVHGAQIGRGGI